MASGSGVALDIHFENPGKILPAAFYGDQKYDAAVKEGDFLG
jgi:hypothetical protein